MTEQRAAERHLDAVTLAGLGARERSLLVHVAGCVACRRQPSAEERDQLASRTDPEADAAIRRLTSPDHSRSTPLSPMGPLPSAPLPSARASA